VDRQLIPLGTLEQVAGGPFDFLQARRIGSRIDEPNEQLQFAGGYDHNFVLCRTPGNEALGLAARLVHPGSGRALEVWTTEPAVQFYSGNFLDGTARGKGGRRHGHRAALCLETQHFPDSPNRPAFPSTVLYADQTYRSRTVFHFGVDGG
jgi:aldose 1-epimerase